MKMLATRQRGVFECSFTTTAKKIASWKSVKRRWLSGIAALVINCQTFGPKLSKVVSTQPCESAILRLGKLSDPWSARLLQLIAIKKVQVILIVFWLVVHSPFEPFLVGTLEFVFSLLNTCANPRRSVTTGR